MADRNLKSITFPGLPNRYVIKGGGEAIAAEYSASSTYAVGEYCMYNNALYRCTTAITTAEAWTAAHWTAAKIGEDLTDCSRQLSDLETRLKSGDEEDADLHLGFYLDENGDLCQVDEEVNNG